MVIQITWKNMLQTQSASARSRVRRCLIAIFSLGCLYLLFTLNSDRSYPAMTKTLEKTYAPPTPEAYKETKILLVSALFPLESSKHSHEEYAYWLSEFLQHITTDVYFFTSPEFAPAARKACGEGFPITIDTTYSSPFDIPPLKGREEAYEKMHKIDRENSYHSPGLYAVWSAKSFFLDAGVNISAKHGKVYDYAFWNDGGSFRGKHKYKDWPDSARVEQVWRKGEEITGRKKEDLLFFALTGMYDEDSRNWTEDLGPIDQNISEGSFFGGSPSTVSWWARTYYAYHDYYISLGYFAGKDQTVFNGILLLFNERVINMYYYDPGAPARQGRGMGETYDVCDAGFLGACGSQWYYYQFWLSSSETREEMRNLWLDEAAQNWKGWKEAKICRETERCRLTRLISLKDALKERFGAEWTSPLRSLQIPEETYWQN